MAGDTYGAVPFARAGQPDRLFFVNGMHQFERQFRAVFN